MLYNLARNLEICEKVGMAHDVNKKLPKGARVAPVGFLQ